MKRGGLRGKVWGEDLGRGFGREYIYFYEVYAKLSSVN